MKCLILAGGRGTRLGEITKNLPKPLVKVANKPVIEHIIDRLNLHGIHQIIINTHYLAEAITEEMESKALYYYVPQLLGHKGTIYALKEWLQDDDFMVVNADTLSDVNYSEMMQNHKEGTITVYMDEWRAAGTWIYSKDYFKGELPVIPYRPHSNWFDVGTPERLAEAKEFYEK